MKPKESNLEKNISRLVKLAGGSDEPTRAFTDSVVSDALSELEGKGAEGQDEGSNRGGWPAGRLAGWLKVLAYAASIIVVSGVILGVAVPKLTRSRQPSYALVSERPADSAEGSSVRQDQWAVVSAPQGEVRKSIEQVTGPTQIHRYSYQEPVAMAEADKSVAADKSPHVVQPTSPQQYSVDQTVDTTRVLAKVTEDVDKSRPMLEARSGTSNEESNVLPKVDSPGIPAAADAIVDVQGKPVVRPQKTEPSVVGETDQLAGGLTITNVVITDRSEGHQVPVLGDTPITKFTDEGKKQDSATGAYANVTVPGPAAATEPVKVSKVVDSVGLPRAVGLDIKDGDKRATRVACYVPPRPAEPGSGGHPMAHGGTTPPNGEDVDAMFFKNYGVNPFVDTEDDHLSTFATDVDTGSYTIVRGYLQDGHLPPEKAVRVEEFVNYFKYDYPAPQESVFEVYSEAAPWKFGTGRKNSYLLRLGLKGKRVSDENRKAAVLTFVIDVSGSMRRENRLGLVKKCLRMLVDRLREEDEIGIAVYGSRGRKVMDHKGLAEKAEILAAIEALHASGSTYAEEGIRIGYEMAQKEYKKGLINRIILCSDGVANVGKTGADDIVEMIRGKAEKGITLSAIGFGMGNYNDVLLERLGDKGNGHYVYIDTIAEAKRIFQNNLTGTLQVIARDVKVQVDFNPEVVRSYRLIGYENRDVPDDKFRDDKYDGGEIGAGHSVTALYELKLWPDKEGTAATTYVRYKHPDSREVTEFKSPIAAGDFDKSFGKSSNEFRLAATVAEFAEILRKSYWARGAKLDSVLARAQQLSRELKDDPDVIELVDLISKAKQLTKSEKEQEPVEIEEE